jgi:uncharacterized protein YrrD
MRELKGDAIVARNGSLGSVKDVYFDDERWAVRYLVVHTGGWLSGRDVLISPDLVRRRQGGMDELHVELTREQLEGAPGTDQDPPASQLYEAARGAGTGYAPYRTGAFVWLGAPLPVAAPPAELAQERSAVRAEAQAQAQKRAEQSHLRSTAEVVGYRIRAHDGELGHVEDFVVDSDTWAIIGMVVDTRNWLPGKEVLIAPSAIESVDWHAKEVAVRCTRAEVEGAPEAQSP